MDVDSHLVHTATWIYETEGSGGGGFYRPEPVKHEEPLPCWWEFKRERVVDVQGAEVTSEALVICTAEVKEGHKLVSPFDDPSSNNRKEWPVKQVSLHTDMSGNYSHVEVRL